MTGKYYVYEHIGVSSREVFYVGKGCGHRCDAKTDRNSCWEKRVAKEGGFQVNIIASGLSNEEAIRLEKRKIDASGWYLTNNCNPKKKQEDNWPSEASLADALVIWDALPAPQALALIERKHGVTSTRNRMNHQRKKRAQNKLGGA